MDRGPWTKRVALALAAATMASAAPAQVAVAETTRGSVAMAQGAQRVELLIDRQDRATLRVVGADGRKVSTVKLVVPGQVVPLLIDRRVAFLWPALAAWAGPSLERLRARVIADSDTAFTRARKAYGNELTPYVGGKAAVYAERAILLASVGRSEQAIALLRKVTDEWTPGRPWGRTEQGMLVTNLAGLLATYGRFEEADRLLAAAPQRLGPGSHLLNIMASHAIMLADAGRYREALAVVDATARQYEATSRTIGGMLTTIPGSERYFAGVRGCALAGLGRKAEADAALRPLLGDREPASLIQKVPETNGEIRLRIFACLRDRPAYARQIMASIAADAAGPPVLTLMQPAFRSRLVDPTLLDATRADPQVAAMLASVARTLPPELVPALNDWEG